MTTGQRIAQKRKEAKLSQEALGAELGVSRQSIYKWESDAVFPEIDKLVTLSRRFGVTVGWLLGVEDGADMAPPTNNSELTDTQLKAVEEIVERYLAALPQPKKQKWPAVMAALVLLCVAVNLFNRLEQLNHQYTSLSFAVSSVERSVDHQISGISDRVEEILKQQNNLTAEYGTELANVSASGGGQGTAVFSAYAVPKTYTEGMTAEFHIQEHGPDGGANVVLGKQGAGQQFYADAISCELTDEMSLSVVFVLPDGTRQTQLLDTYTGLYSDSLPQISIQDYYLMLMGKEIPNGTLSVEEGHITVSWEPGQAQGQAPAAEVSEIRVGVFRNQSLWCWLEACEQPDSFHGDYPGEQFYRLADLTLSHLSAAETVHIAALVTDTYGRQFMACDVPYVVSREGDVPCLTYPASADYDKNPAHWSFAP